MNGEGSNPPPAGESTPQDSLLEPSPDEGRPDRAEVAKPQRRALALRHIDLDRHSDPRRTAAHQLREGFGLISEAVCANLDGAQQVEAVNHRAVEVGQRDVEQQVGERRVASRADATRERAFVEVRRVGQHDVGLAERVAHQWEAAYAFEQSRGPSATASIPTLVVSAANPSATIGAWLRQHKPDAVISRCNDVLAAASALKLRVPRDLGYVSLNVLDDAPGVSGILQHRDVMGAAAVDALHGLLHRNHRGPHTVARGTQIDGSWHEGRTVRKLGRKAGL